MAQVYNGPCTIDDKKEAAQHKTFKYEKMNENIMRIRCVYQNT